MLVTSSLKSDGYVKSQCLCMLYSHVCLCVCVCVCVAMCVVSKDILTFTPYTGINIDSKIIISICTNISISSVTSAQRPSEELTVPLSLHLHLFKYTLTEEEYSLT